MMQWYDKLFIVGMLVLTLGFGLTMWGFAAMIFSNR